MLLTVRQAIPSDIPALRELIRASVLGLQTADYTPDNWSWPWNASSA